MNAEEIRAYLEEHNPEAIFWDDCDSALIGTARIKRETDGDWVHVAMYSYEFLVGHFMRDFQKTYKEKNEIVPSHQIEEEAIEYVDYNIVGAYVGINTPLVIYT